MDTDKIVLRDHVLLRCVTDLRSFRHICDLLIKHYPNLKAVTLDDDLVRKLCDEMHLDRADTKPLAGHWLIVYTREPNQVLSDEGVTEAWHFWRRNEAPKVTKCT